MKKEDPPHYWCFPNEGVFYNSSQDEVYATVTDGLVEKLLEGSSAIILSYGQTGSGKSFTMAGLLYHYENRGILLRLFSELFDEKDKRRYHQSISYSLSYVELLGNHFRDLLLDTTTPTFPDKKFVSQREIPNEYEAWRTIFEAETRKSIDSSAPYNGSHRGHSVLTIHIKRQSLIDTDPLICYGKVHLVDMAGVDNYGSKASSWRSKYDVGRANSSKTFLEQFILCLTGMTIHTGHDKPPCPKKSDKLVEYISDILKPDCILRYVAHIYGTRENLPLSLSILRFGEKFRRLKPSKITLKTEPDCLINMKLLEKELERLRGELQLNEMLRDSPNYTMLSQEKLQQVRRSAMGYIQGFLQDLTLLSLGQAGLTLEVFKDLYNKLLIEKDVAVQEAIAATREEVTAALMKERSQNTTSTISTSNKSVKRSRSSMKKEETSSTTLTTVSSVTMFSKESSATTINEPAGETDRAGISIGPGKSLTHYEGSITKAIKSSRSKQAVNPIKENGSVPKKENSSKSVESIMTLPFEIPSRTVAWEEFTAEMTDTISDMEKNIDVLSQLCKEAQRKYMLSIRDLAERRKELEKIKTDLLQAQHINCVLGAEDQDEEGYIIPNPYETRLLQEQEQKEREIDEALEQTQLAIIQVKTIYADLMQAKCDLETTFQEFCKEKYKCPIVKEEPMDSISTTKQPSVISETVSEKLKKARMCIFYHLQKQMMQAIKVQPKKEWDQFFYLAKN